MDLIIIPNFIMPAPAPTMISIDCSLGQSFDISIGTGTTDIDFGDGTTIKGATGEIHHDYGVTGTFIVTISNPKNVTDLEIPGANIQTITGLSSIPTLKTLNLNANQIQTIDVSQNIALQNLQVNGNQLQTLDVTNLVNLTELDCDTNLLTEIDVSKNVNLTYLDCGANQLTTVDVSNNINLTEFDCGDNQLTTVDITNLIKLFIHDCSSNPISSIDVSKNTLLTYLTCQDCTLTSIDVSKNTGLTDLNVEACKLTELDISHNPLITRLFADSQFLSSDNINTILHNWVGFGQSNGFTEINNQTPPAPPTGQGITDAATLVGRGWYIQTD